MDKVFDMPEWMLKDENYIPQSDKETFINKSILSILSILSKIKTQDKIRTAKYEINEALKVTFTFILLILLSISRSFIFVIVINVYLLVNLSSMEANDILKILRVSFVMAFLTFLILLPSAIWGNSFSSVMITSKIFATITAVNILSYSTRWSSMTRALKRFFVPDIFILVLDITVKYIVMLGEFALNMLLALKLRSVGKNKQKYTSLSGIGGTMFIKSKEMAEEMLSAMECRGFTGEYNVNRQFKYKFVDIGYIIVNIAIVYIFAYFERI